MDGFAARAGVVVMAATNRPDILDTALLRPGRFDRRITLDPPDLKGRAAILAIHAGGKPLADDVNLPAIARQTAGFSGADLANVVNEAALLAIRRSASGIEATDFGEAVERVVAGPHSAAAASSPRPTSAGWLSTRPAMPSSPPPSRAPAAWPRSPWSPGATARAR